MEKKNNSLKKEKNTSTSSLSYTTILSSNNTNITNPIVSMETNKLRESLYIPPLAIKSLLEGKSSGEKWEIINKELEKYFPKAITTKIKAFRYPPSNNIIIIFNTLREKEEFENLSKLQQENINIRRNSYTILFYRIQRSTINIENSKEFLDKLLEENSSIKDLGINISRLY